MKKGLFIFILCLSIMLIGCPAATSGDANDANGTNTGSNDGNGGSGNNGGNSGNTGDNGGSGTGNTGNTGVITSVENEFVYYDNEKECYVGSVTWKAESSFEQTTLMPIVSEIKFCLFDANDAERGEIPVSINIDSKEMSVTGTVKKNALVQYGTYEYYDDYLEDWVTSPEEKVICDIPGIKVKALLYFTEENRAPIMIGDPQIELISKGKSSNSLKDLTSFPDVEFIDVGISYKDYLIHYSFNWKTFLDTTKIIPASVQLSSFGVTGNVTKIDWSKSDVLNKYFNNQSDSIRVANFNITMVGTGEYPEGYENQSEHEIMEFTLNGDKKVSFPEDDSQTIIMTVVSTRGETYKFQNQLKPFRFDGNWTYTK
jgi:hypothetical protein